MESPWMMKTKQLVSYSQLALAAAALFSLPLAAAHAQGSSAPAASAPAHPAASAAASAPDRSKAYYHAALAGIDEEEAVNSGRPEFVTHAIEEYKDALNADPSSTQLSNALADLYFRAGRTRDAEATARGLLKTAPNDLDAHKLLGRIYLRQLGESQNAVSSSSPSGNVLDQAIAEYEKIVDLDGKDVSNRMVLGQLYSVKHQPQKAEAQFKIAQSIDPDSEEVVLNLARLHAESGDMQLAAKVIEDVPVQDRTAKMESVLGATYDQLKRPKDAIAAYRRALDMEPGEARTIAALAQSLLNDDQLDEALKQYRDLLDADPDDVASLIRVSEILRRQGKYEDALASAKKAAEKDADNLEAGYNQGLLLDVLGRYDEAVHVYQHMVELTSHANGAYTGEEKNNRGIFLARLASVYHEQNKVDLAVATYQKMIDMGGDSALQGYQGQVDTFRDAKQFDKAVETARKASGANPSSSDFKLILAEQLIDQGKADEAIAMAKGLLKNTDDDRRIWLELGQMNTRLHRWKDAEDALTKASGMTTKKEDRLFVLFLRGSLAERQKRIDAAEDLFRQALDIDPSNAMVLNYLGYMLADKGLKLPEALKMIRKAVEQEPMNGAYLDSLGWAYFKLGQYELAEENLRQAVERDQTDPTVHQHLGDLYEKTGRIRLAAAQWQLSLTQYSRSAAADVEPADVAKLQRKLETARVKLAKEESLTGVPKSE